jgi:hypothetical protein
MPRLKILVLFTSLFLSTSLFAQMPLEFQNAIDKSTRTTSGIPGSNYWQNRSEYNIDVHFATAERKLSGTEKITYYNNSPDTLNFIVIRLYQNWNIPGKSRNWDIDTSMFTQGVKIESALIDKSEINISDRNRYKISGTNLILVPVNPVLPHSSATLDFKWSFIFPPKTNIRCGYYDSTSYMVAYWYPQIAVYDDIDGWDMNDYTGMTEFYNDFSDYNVRITTDLDNAIIIATGELQNARDIFSESFYERYLTASSSEDINTLFDPRVMLRAGLFKNTGILRVWNFTAHNVCDFAFAFSDHYIWEKTSAPADNSQRTCINVFYKPGAPNFDKVSSITQKLMEYYKNSYPGIFFPYPAINIFNGSGGMEYPMMANDGASESAVNTVHVTSHEISHTFFPFYMGTNERKYAWMDEGWAQFLPMDFQSDMTGTDVRAGYSKTFVKLSGTLEDAPLLTLSTNLHYESYRFNAYTKSWAMYNELKYLLGEDKFKTALKEFINRWNGRHPIPIDFTNTFESVYGSNMDWFWQKWLYGFAYCKPECSNFKYSKGNLYLTLKNKGGLPAHFDIKIYINGKSANTISYSAEIWKADQASVSLSIPCPQKPDSIEFTGDAFASFRTDIK